MNYSDIILKKFVFFKSDPSKDFQHFIWGLPFVDHGTQEGEVRYKVKDAATEIKNQIIDFLDTIPMDDYLKNSIKHFGFDINRMQKDEWVPMHNEVSQKSPFEVIIWLTRTDSYEGREFVMKGPGLDEKVRPTNGLVCFLDTTTPDIYHGVNKLLSDTEVISITGGLGRKDGYLK